MSCRLPHAPAPRLAAHATAGGAPPPADGGGETVRSRPTAGSRKNSCPGSSRETFPTGRLSKSVCTSVSGMVRTASLVEGPVDRSFGVLGPVDTDPHPPPDRRPGCEDGPRPRGNARVGSGQHRPSPGAGSSLVRAPGTRGPPGTRGQTPPAGPLRGSPMTSSERRSGEDDAGRPLRAPSGRRLAPPRIAAFTVAASMSASGRVQVLSAWTRVSDRPSRTACSAAQSSISVLASDPSTPTTTAPAVFSARATSSTFPRPTAWTWRGGCQAAIGCRRSWLPRQGNDTTGSGRLGACGPDARCRPAVRARDHGIWECHPGARATPTRRPATTAPAHPRARSPTVSAYAVPSSPDLVTKA